MKYTKITGTFLNFKDGKRLKAGISYSSQTINLQEHKIVIKTYENNIIETVLTLEAPDFLNFKRNSDDPRIPIISGRFLNTDYEESLISCSLPDKKINISGVITKLDQLHALSAKTLTGFSSGKIIAVMQEHIELISESQFNTATSSK